LTDQAARPAVLDASALLAFLQGEPGSGVVESALPGASISSVNWAEVLQKSLARDVVVAGLREDMEAMGLRLVPFGAEDAEATALLWPRTRSMGLSLADRACLALGMRLDGPVLTADRKWGEISLGVEVRLIR